MFCHAFLLTLFPIVSTVGEHKINTQKRTNQRALGILHVPVDTLFDRMDRIYRIKALENPVHPVNPVKISVSGIEKTVSTFPSI